MHKVAGDWKDRFTGEDFLPPFAFRMKKVDYFPKAG
jgi:hypothetical protein